MTDAVLISVANDIVTQFNAATLSIDVQAERSYADWDDVLKDIGIRCDVVPVSTLVEQEDRGSLLYTCTVHVMIRKRFDVTDQDASTGRIAIANVDELVRLVEETSELFAPAAPIRTGILPNVLESAFREMRPGTWFHRRHLREHRQFTGIVRVDHTVNRVPG